MAIQTTVCRICKKTVKSNGTVGLRREIEEHFIAFHQEEWLNYLKQRDSYNTAVKEAIAKLAIEANLLVEDPNLILPPRAR